MSTKTVTHAKAPTPAPYTPVIHPVVKPPTPVPGRDAPLPAVETQLATATRLGYHFGPLALGPRATTVLQPKLRLGPVNDPYEQEADRTAAAVVQRLNAPDAAVQRQPEGEENEAIQPKLMVQRQATPPEEDELQRQAAPEEDDEQVQTKPLLQRQSEPEEEEQIQTKALIQRQPMPEEDEEAIQRQTMPDEDEEAIERQTMPEEDDELVQIQSLLQRQPMPEEDEEEVQRTPAIQTVRPNVGRDTVDPPLERSIQSVRGGGQPLAAAVRKPLEQHFGADFSQVKIHTDGRADTLNRSLQARAFTTGQDLFFRAGEYNPQSTAGQQLLAHELTHVIQQGGGRLVQRRKRDDHMQPIRPGRFRAKHRPSAVSPPMVHPMIQRRITLASASTAPTATWAAAENTILPTPAERAAAQVQSQNQIASAALPLARQREPQSESALFVRPFMHNLAAAPNTTIQRGVGDFLGDVWSETKELGAKAVSGLSSLGSKVLSSLRQLGSSFLERLEQLGDLAVTWGPRIAQFITNPIGALVGSLWLSFPRQIKLLLTDKLLEFSGAIMNRLRSRWAVLLGPIWPLVGSLMHGFIEHMRQVGDDDKVTLSDKLANIMRGGSLSFLWGVIKGLGLGLWDVIKMPYDLIVGLVDGVKFIGQVLSRFGLEAIEAGMAMISNALPAAFDGLRSMITNARQALRFLQTIWESISGAVSRIGEGLAGALLRFVRLPEEEMGEQVGRLAAEFGVDALLAVFTAGAGTLLRQAGALIRRFMAWFKRGGRALGQLVSMIRSAIEPLLNGAQRIGQLFRNSRFGGWMDDFSQWLSRLMDSVGDVVNRAKGGGRSGRRALGEAAEDVGDASRRGRRAVDDVTENAEEYVEARAITGANERMGTPVQALISLLSRRFPSRRFSFTPLAPGHSRVVMRATLDGDYIPQTRHLNITRPDLLARYEQLATQKMPRVVSDVLKHQELTPKRKQLQKLRNQFENLRANIGSRAMTDTEKAQALEILRESRDLARADFDTLRSSVWRRLRSDPELRSLADDMVTAGDAKLSGRSGSVRIRTQWDDSREGFQALEIEHRTRLSDNPWRYNDPNNLMLTDSAQNQQFLEAVRREGYIWPTDEIEEFITSRRLLEQSNMGTPGFDR